MNNGEILKRQKDYEWKSIADCIQVKHCEECGGAGLTIDWESHGVYKRGIWKGQYRGYSKIKCNHCNGTGHIITNDNE